MKLNIKHDIKKAADTGSWRSSTPIVDKKKCTGCGTCVKYCPEAVMELNEQETMNNKQKKTVMIDYKFCKVCGVCKEVCLFKAIDMVSSN